MSTTKFQLLDECLGYRTSTDETNEDARYLVSGSKNVLIDQQRQVKTRAGYTRLGASNSALTPVRTAKTWNTSTGTELPTRQYDDELEAYLDTVDGTSVAAWTRVFNGLSTTAKVRSALWWDTTENLDLFLFIQGSANVYEWSGGVAVVSSITGTTITKTGTPTFAENRFYATRNMTLFCVRTGTEYTYTGGTGTTTLTGIADTTGLIAGDVLIQKVVTNASEPAAGRNNHTIHVHENQLVLGSEDDQEVFISKNTDFKDFAFSTPRLPGEGALLSLEDPAGGFGSVGQVLVIFAGRNGVYKTEYAQITVGSTLSETLKVKKIQSGVDQAAISPDCIVSIGDELAYISYEPALRIITDPQVLAGIDPKTYSNPIQPDFDDEDWTGCVGHWFKNTLHITSNVNSKLYMLVWDENENGKIERYWQPPQTFPVGPLSTIDGALYGHSNSVPESYRLFYGTSDGEYTDMAVEDKFAIHSIALFAYRNFGDREKLKTHDEFYLEGKITAGTDFTATLYYDFGGDSGNIQKTIDGADAGIVFENASLASLGQSPFGTNPLGGASVEPENTLKYRVVFEMPKEDYHEIQEKYESEQVDAYWSILSRGPNTTLSSKRDSVIRR